MMVAVSAAIFVDRVLIESYPNAPPGNCTGSGEGMSLLIDDMSSEVAVAS
jgi:hypothetical protein